MSNTLTTKRSNRGRVLILALILINALLVAFMLAGCSYTPAKATADPQASSATTAEEEPAAQPTEDPADAPKAFGDTVTWDNNVSISVSDPKPYKATDYAAGVTAGQKQVYFTLVLTNHSAETYTPVLMVSASSGGEEASDIFDIDGPQGDMGTPPTTKVLPGKTIKWKVAFSVADASDITLQVSPGFEYTDAIFTNSK